MNSNCVIPFHSCSPVVYFYPRLEINKCCDLFVSTWYTEHVYKFHSKDWQDSWSKGLNLAISITFFFLQQCISSGCSSLRCVYYLRILYKWVLSSLLVSADNKKACSESRSCTQKPAAKEGEHQLLGNWNFSAVTFPSSWQLNNCQYAIGLYSAAWEQQAEACSDGTGHAASPFPGRLTTLYFAFWPLTEHVNQWNLKFWTPV